MGLLTKKSDKRIWAEDEIKKYSSELKPILGNQGIANMTSTVATIAENQGFEEALAYIEYTRGRIDYYNNKKNDYLIEAKLADGVYKSYITDGISRIEKVNGRFMAAQNMKLDLLIEQNTRIIQLLEKIAGEDNETNSMDNISLLGSTINKNNKVDYIDEEIINCPSCDYVVKKGDSFCENCGTKL